MVKELDPDTVTLEEMAQASRSLRQARWTAVAVGLIVAAVLWSPVVESDRLANTGLAIVALVVPAAVAYRLVYEVLVRVLPPR